MKPKLIFFVWLTTITSILQTGAGASSPFRNLHLNPFRHLSEAIFIRTKRAPQVHHPAFCRLKQPLTLNGGGHGNSGGGGVNPSGELPTSSASASATKGTTIRGSPTLATQTASLPTTSTQTDPPPSGPGNGNGGGHQDGVINVKSTCGDIGATVKVTLSSGPNGSQDWLDCGLESTGWKPQHVTLDDLVYHQDLLVAMAEDNSPFKACKGLLDIILKYADRFNVPAVMIASIALQESGCNADVKGQGGEQGIMQISQDKCNGAPDGNCLDPDFNIMRGTQYFRAQLDSNGGNVLKTLGNYNGWYDGMTEADARKAASGDCCRCQQNLDYIHAMVNGWLQNVNAYNPRMGKYFNLDVCNKK